MSGRKEARGKEAGLPDSAGVAVDRVGGAYGVAPLPGVGADAG